MLLTGRRCWEFSALNVTADPRRKESLVHLQGGAKAKRKHIYFRKHNETTGRENKATVQYVYTEKSMQAADMLKYQY